MCRYCLRECDLCPNLSPRKSKLGFYDLILRCGCYWLLGKKSINPPSPDLGCLGRLIGGWVMGSVFTQAAVHSLRLSTRCLNRAMDARSWAVAWRSPGHNSIYLFTIDSRSIKIVRCTVLFISLSLLGTWLTTVRLFLTLPVGAIYVPQVVVTYSFRYAMSLPMAVGL